MKYLSILTMLVVSANAFAQSFSGGIPIPGLPNSTGQKTSAGSTSVVLASDQSPVPISGTISASNPSVGTNSIAAPSSSTQIGYVDGSGLLQPFRGNASGITVSATQGTDPWSITGTVHASQVGVWDIRNITGSVTLPSGAATAAAQATGNTSLASIDSKIGGPISVTATPYSAASSSVSRVANAVTSQTLLNSNASRKGVILFLDDSSANCSVKLGATASSTSYAFKLYPLDTYFMSAPIYTGQIDYICSAASGNMEVNEL